MDRDKKASCVCKRVHCKRHGNCKECITYHAQNAKFPLPVCLKLKKKKGNTYEKKYFKD